ncbi:pantetheine-phosphate adenylyltransferase [Aliikangiella sp. IMCC44359]|uniref:pantetheine-phosphate adenylyltransferase n=1 Tax=Aliikangiella sp. IMCC44359 TaxID=3459125 RepID=UPI00403B33C1
MELNQSQISSNTYSQQSKAVYAFSADPITNGHINLVTRISDSFQQVIVGIGRNPLKSYLFSLEERLSLAKKALQHLPNVRVVSFRGMVVDFACEQGANIIVKGIRNATDFDYEQTHHQVGVSQQAGIDTHILFADPTLAHVSSSAVKAIQIEHGTLEKYVPLVVKSALEAKISKQLIVGITGEIASGKSTLCEQLVETANDINIPIHHIDLDSIGHELLQANHSPLHQKTSQAVIDKFGEDICIDGVICRKKLAKKIFFNSNYLNQLNTILLNPVKVLIRKKIYGKKGLILINGALLAEAELLSICNNQLILIDVPSNIQLKRLKKRGYSSEEITNRQTSQYSFTQKKISIEKSITAAQHGKLWIKNTLALETKKQIIELLKSIINESNAKQLFNIQEQGDIKQC